VLGGSSSINAMLYVRGQAADYDGWAQMGAQGWSWEDCLPYFRKSQDQQRGACNMHGVDGPLTVSDFPEVHEVSGALLKACEEAGIRAKADLNDGDQEGCSPFQLTTRNGMRCSTAVAFLHPAMKRANLQVETHAMATRILFDGKRAVGVEFMQNGRKRTVKAAREVILAAGAVESPKLLEISGIGQGKLLQSLGVEVVHESPMVGENMQDHVMIGVQARLKETAHSINHRTRGLNLIGEILKYGLTRKGVLAMSVAHGQVFLKSREELETPDVQLHVMAASMDLEALATTQTMQLEKLPGLTCTPCQLRPESRGSIHAKSPDGMVNPSIVPNYFSAPYDREMAVTQLKIIRRILGQPALSQYLAEGVPYGETDEEMFEYAKVASSTLYHVVGTVAMGPDERYPLDPKLRVRGVDGLRVVDASVMPRLVSGNTNAPTIMIAEKGSDLILQDARQPAYA
jgi:choline dehydrogenase